MFDLTRADEELDSSSPLLGLIRKENPLELFLETVPRMLPHVLDIFEKNKIGLYKSG